MKTAICSCSHAPCEDSRCGVIFLDRRWSVFKTLEDGSCDEVCGYRLGVRRLISNGYTCGSCENRCATSLFRAFSNGTELQEAVDAYLADKSESTEVAKMYGYPIGAWCVEKVTDFSALFKEASTFNDDLSVRSTLFVTKESRVVSVVLTHTPTIVFRLGTCQVPLIYQTCFNVQLYSIAILALGSSATSRAFITRSGTRTSSIPTRNWDTNNVSSFEGTFSGAHLFNSDICKWDTSGALTTEGMFEYAHAFN